MVKGIAPLQGFARMRKSFAVITNRLLSTVIAVFLILLFVLTQKTYETLCQSNEAVLRTGNIINGYQKVAADFKDAIIYLTTYKNSPSQVYLNTYGKGLWEIRMDMYNLKKLVSKAEQMRLNQLANQIYVEEEWLSNPGTDNPELYDAREQHIKNIIVIQNFLNNKMAGLYKQSVRNVRAADHMLNRLHFWIIVLIITTSAVITLAVYFIRKQFARVAKQNQAFVEIAWMQSHKVRAQIAVLLGLGQLFNKDDAGDEENIRVIDYITTTAHKLDTIVREINDKANCS